MFRMFCVYLGGQLSNISDADCTHLVVDNVQTLPDSTEIRHNISVVRAEWFWASVQMQTCADESIHIAEVVSES